VREGEHRQLYLDVCLAAQKKRRRRRRRRRVVRRVQKEVQEGMERERRRHREVKEKDYCWSRAHTEQNRRPRTKRIGGSVENHPPSFT